jgi:hypothetical protein
MAGFRIIDTIILLAAVVGLSCYGYVDPPVREPLLNELKENVMAQFQHFPLRVVSVLPDGVVLEDRRGFQAVCSAHRGMAVHPAVQNGGYIDAKITMRNGKCLMVESADGSGYRTYKIALSVLTLCATALYFIRYFFFDWKKLVFRKRDLHA